MVAQPVEGVWRRVGEPNRPTGTVESVLARVDALIEVGRAVDARAVLAPLLATQPHDVQLWCADALAARLSGDPQGAVASASRAAGLGPGWPPALAELALCLVDVGRVRDAVPVALQAVAMRPDDVWYHVVASVSLRDAGRAEEALAAAQTCIRLAPQSAQAHELAGRACLARKQPGEAEEHLRRAVELEPQRVSAVTGLADALAAQRRRAEAVELYARAVKLDPDDQWAVKRVEKLIGEISDRVLAPYALMFAAVAAAGWALARVTGHPELGTTIVWVAFFGAVVVGVVVLKLGWRVKEIVDPVTLHAVEELSRARRRQNNQASGGVLLGGLGFLAVLIAGLSLVPGRTGTRSIPWAGTIGLVLVAGALFVGAVVIHRRRPLAADIMATRRREQGLLPVIGLFAIAGLSLLIALVAALGIVLGGTAGTDALSAVVVYGIVGAAGLAGGIYVLISLRAARASSSREVGRGR